MSLPHILIIDDEIEVCMLLSNYLTKKQYEVDYATTLKEGIELFRKINPGIIILDNNLPDGYGIDNIGLFREFDPDVLVILISARSDLKEDAIEKGANSFMEKPISFSLLNSFLEDQQA
ncbi:MAG: response regulator [Bacteroidia bacterium]